MADRITQYIQAFEALGAGTGTTVGLLSLNRPEVLMIIGAGQTQGYRRISLHPLGSLDDHAYVLSDAGVTTLIIDPNPMFIERALGLLEKVRRRSSRSSRSARCPTRWPMWRWTSTPRPPGTSRGRWSPPTSRPISRRAELHRWHNRQAQGCHDDLAGHATMTRIQLSEWEWPENPRFLMITPLSHAGAAFFMPTVVKGGEMIVLSKFDPAEVLKAIEEKRSRRRWWCRRCFMP